MKYAIVSGQRVEAYPRGRGTCCRCSGEVIAKCGTHRVSHWAHRGMRNCDTWAEKETDWHRAWKNNFPPEFQEFIQYDEKSGEKHIADVRTPHGLVIEFQHSHLDPLERTAREQFYGNMVWVVDGARLQRDYPRFNSGKDGLRRTPAQGHYLLTFPEECFPATWLDSSVPVIFDFRGTDEGQPPDAFRDGLWCLLPGRAERSAVVVRMSREQFIKVVPSTPQLFAAQELLEAFAQYIRESRASTAHESPQFFRMPSGRALRRRYSRF